MLGNTVCTAQEWRSRLCRGDVVNSDNRSQLPGFSRAAVYNGGEDPVHMGVPDNLQVDGGGDGYGMPPLWICRRIQMRAIRYGHRWIQANPAIRSNSPAYRFGASYSGQWPSNQ